MIFNSTLLTGQRILVTGASSGIGRATAVLLAECGAQLVLTGRDQPRLAQTMSILAGAGHVSRVFNLDGSDDIVDFMKEQTADEQPLSGMFHAAGVELARAIKLSKYQHVEHVFSSSIHSALALARGAALRGVMRDGATLLFMSSIAAQSGQPGLAVYAAAKAAIDGMVRSLAMEMAPRGMRVNSIAAGAVCTEMHARHVRSLSAEALLDYEQRHPLGFGRVEDIAQVAAFLFSDAGRWISGATWNVDGGYGAR